MKGKRKTDKLISGNNDMPVHSHASHIIAGQISRKIHRIPKAEVENGCFWDIAELLIEKALPVSTMEAKQPGVPGAQNLYIEHKI